MVHRISDINSSKTPTSDDFRKTLALIHYQFRFKDEKRSAICYQRKHFDVSNSEIGNGYMPGIQGRAVRSACYENRKKLN